MKRLSLARAQVLRYRRQAGALDHRRASGAASIARAAEAGLQDSMPRAALLSLHARVEGTTPDALANPVLVQVWGPRYSAFVVPARDHAVFTLGRMPDAPAKRREFEQMAERLDVLLDGGEMPADAAERALGVGRNRLRYATLTGRLLIRWDGARQQTVRVVPPPTVDAFDARLELARRHLRVFGPTRETTFARWAGVGAREARAAYQSLLPELVPVRTPIGDAWILARDLEALDPSPGPEAPARLLPSGDAYTLLQDDERALLLPEATQRAALWTPRVWPGAVLVEGEIVGVWRRAGGIVSIEPWQRLSRAQRNDVEAEAATLPLPGLGGGITVRWET